MTSIQRSSDLLFALSTLSLTEIRLEQLPDKSNKEAYLRHLRSVLLGDSEEKFDIIPEEAREAIFSWLLSYSTETQNCSLLQDLIYMIPYINAAPDWQNIRHALLTLADKSIQEPTKLFAKALTTYIATTAAELRYSDIAQQVSLFADLACKWPKDATPTDIQEPQKIARTNCCKILWQMVKNNGPLIILKVLYQLHKSNRNSKSPLNPKSPAWSEELRGPERSLFLHLVSKSKLPSSIRNGFVEYYIKDGATQEGISLCIELAPSLRTWEFKVLVKNLQKAKEDARLEALADQMNLPQFPVKQRSRVFQAFLDDKSAPSLAFAAQIAKITNLTVVWDILNCLDTLLPPGEDATEDHQNTLTNLFRAIWHEDDKEKRTGLLEKLSMLSARCELKKLPKSRWSKKMEEIIKPKITSPATLRPIRASPENPQSRKFSPKIVAIPTAKHEKPQSPDPQKEPVAH